MHTPNRPILDYRTAGAGAADALHLVRLIRLWDALFRLKVTAMLAAGLALSFVGPALLAWLIAAIYWRWTEQSVNWWIIFGACSAVVPLLYLTEWRSRGEFFLQEMRAQGAGSDVTAAGMLRTGSYGEWELRTNMASFAGLIEILLFAPRLVFDGWEQLTGERSLRPVDLGFAAGLLQTLARQQQSLPTADVLGTPDLLRLRTLHYLRFHDWIDLSKEQDRIWLAPAGRRIVKEARWW